MYRQGAEQSDDVFHVSSMKESIYWLAPAHMAGHVGLYLHSKPSGVGRHHAGRLPKLSIMLRIVDYSRAPSNGRCSGQLVTW